MLGMFHFNCFYFITVISTLDTASSVFCDDKYTSFFNKQARCYGSNVKNGLKVKQLTKHLPTLKMLMGKILVLDS